MQLKTPPNPLKTITTTLLCLFAAGGLGGLVNSLVVWSLGALGITPATGCSMVPELTLEWLLRRIFASAIWGLIFLVPVFENSPVKKGLLLSIVPWLSSVLIVFPLRMNFGLFGLGLGLGTPVWTYFFAAVWGVTGTVFISRVCPGRSLPVRSHWKSSPRP
jgi:hypothetical protein